MRRVIVGILALALCLAAGLRWRSRADAESSWPWRGSIARLYWMDRLSGSVPAPQCRYSALALPPDRAQQIRANARQTAETHSLLREQQAFLDVLHNIDQLW